MALYFITGNANKFADAKAILPEIEQLDIDLVEIQELDPKVIMKEKLNEAFKHHAGEFIVDDVSLKADGLKGLPGPLVKWFIKSLGLDGVATLIKMTGNDSVSVSTLIGFAKKPGEVYYFESIVRGKIVDPRGKGGFGWDVIFQPEGSDLTFAEWKEDHPGPNVMRLEALNKLKNFLGKE